MIESSNLQCIISKNTTSFTTLHTTMKISDYCWFKISLEQSKHTLGILYFENLESHIIY